MNDFQMYEEGRKESEANNMKDKYFECGASVYSKLGTIYSSTLYGKILEELEEERETFIKKNKKGAEKITFSKIMITTKVLMEDSEESHKLIKGDYTNPYLTMGSEILK